MVATHSGLIPQPAAHSILRMQARRQSSEGSMLFTAVPDPAQAPRRIRYEYRDPHGAIGDVMRRHYDEHALKTFSLTLPRTEEIVTVRWLGPPSLSWSSASSVASIAAEFEEVLAHE